MNAFYTLETAILNWSDLKPGDVLSQDQPNGRGGWTNRVLGTIYAVDGETISYEGAAERMPVSVSRAGLHRWLVEIAEWAVRDADDRIAAAESEVQRAKAWLSTACTDRRAAVAYRDAIARRAAVAVETTP